MFDVTPTDEQRMLQDAARRYFGQSYDFARREKIVRGTPGWDAGVWQDFASLGWLGLPFAPQHGGSGGSMSDLALLLLEFGRALVVEPYLSTVLGGLAIVEGGREEQKQALLPRLVAGELQVAVALEDASPGSPATCERATGRWRVRGHKAVVLGAPSADLLAVPAQAGADTVVLLIERTAPGVSLRAYETIDGRRAADVRLDGVEVGAADVLGAAGDASALVERISQLGALMLACEAAGCCDAAFEQTAQYLNTREQFGQRLAAFQALRHRVADMYVNKEEIRALCLWAARAVSDAHPVAAAAVAGAKSYLGEVGRRVCEEAVQLHGAIAITDEYSVGHYLKRVIAADRLFGDRESQLDRYQRLRGGFEVA